MGKEIERKFLLTGDAWRALAKGTLYRQGYLSSVKERTVRIRTVGDTAFLRDRGAARSWFARLRLDGTGAQSRVARRAGA